MFWIAEPARELSFRYVGCLVVKLFLHRSSLQHHYKLQCGRDPCLTRFGMCALPGVELYTELDFNKHVIHGPSEPQFPHLQCNGCYRREQFPGEKGR